MKYTVISVLCVVAIFDIVFAGKANNCQKDETHHTETRKGQDNDEHGNHKDGNEGRFEEAKTMERESGGKKPKEKCDNCDVCLSEKCTQDIMNSVTITTYPRNGQPTVIPANPAEASQVLKALVGGKKIALFITGLNMASSDDYVRIYCHSFVYNYADFILFIVDASLLFKGNAKKMDPDYIKSAQMTVCVANAVLKRFHPLIKDNIVKAEDISCMGLNLGAQCCGLFGRIFQNKFGQKISYISGLNPAPRCFGECTGLHLNCNDAQIVKCVHTDNQSQSSCGAADFYANGGNVQPIAEEDPSITNSTMAMLYDALVNYNDKTRQCKGWTKDCKSAAYMGYKKGTYKKGKFYFKTCTKSPYCLGDKGKIV